MNSIQVLDLFSGIGGFAHGFENAGDFETVAFCEIDPHAQKVLKKHWPEVPIIEDVRKIRGEDFKEVEVICGGFPCQDISVAGKQKGITNETRSGLWIEYKRIIQEINPRWVVIENVRNLLSNGLAIVLQDLHEIGYDAEWEIISARSVGACHLRERVWIVANPRCRQRRTGNTGDSTELRGRSSNEEEIGSRDSSSIERSSVGREINAEGLETQSSNSESIGVQGLRSSGEQESYAHGEEAVSLCSSEIDSDSASDSDYFRFWPAFTSEEEKLEWWAEATSSIRDWWEVESSVCRVDDGLSSGLDKGRAQRIKQLGNSIVPQIAQIIGSRILYHEALSEL